MSDNEKQIHVGNESDNNPHETTAYSLLKERLQNVLSTLTDREREVLTLRYGLNDGAPRTLKEVGKTFNATRERIRQIEAKALSKRGIKEQSAEKQQEKHMDKMTPRGSGTPRTKEKSDFELLLDEFAEFAKDAAERRLGKDAASDYKSRLRRVAQEIDGEYGAGWFENFAISYAGAGDAKNYGRCVTFIAGRLQAAQGKDKPRWRNRRSAFRKFVDFRMPRRPPRRNGKPSPNRRFPRSRSRPRRALPGYRRRSWMPWSKRWGRMT